MKNKNLTGKTFGRLTVIAISPNKTKHNKIKWYCLCNCPKRTLLEVEGSNLLNSHTKSCGCLRTGNIKHSMNKTVEYKTWARIKRRILNKKDDSYKNYGGRGITISDDWLKFENFYKDMCQRPSSEHSIERIDVNGNYCKENCIWADKAQQGYNKRNTIYLTYNNQTKPLGIWAKELDISYRNIYNRIEQAFEKHKGKEND